MGTVGLICEIVLQVGYIAQGVLEEIIRRQIEELIKGHEHEFQLMEELNEFMDLILQQQNLVNQINLNLLFVDDNWHRIFTDLKSKDALANKILGSYRSIQSSDYSFTLKNELILDVSTSILGYCAYNYAAGLQKNYISSSSTMYFDNYTNTTSATVRSSAPEIKSIQYTPQNGHSVEVLNHGSNPQQAPPKSRSSKIEELKDQEIKGKDLKSRALQGLRIVSVGMAVWKFYKGLKSLKALSDQLDYYRQYFSEEGDFEKAKEGMIELMNYVARDIFTLGCASRAAYFDSQNVLLMASITSARYQESILSYANNLNSKDTGLTDQFIDASLVLAQQAGNISNSGQKSEVRLQKLEKLFNEFYTQKKPETVFLKLATTLSQVIGNYGLIIKNIESDQRNVNSFLLIVESNFQHYRKTDFISKSSQEKQKIDNYIVQQSLKNYLAIFKLASISLQDVINKKEYQDIKNILFSVIISFADLFYYDDPDGASLFGRKITNYKDKKTYQALLLTEKLTSQANVIPVCRTYIQQEEIERKKWLDKAQKENQKLQLWPLGKTPVVQFRYIRVETEIGSFVCFDGTKNNRLLSFEGMRMSVDNVNHYSIEESVNDRKVVLCNI